VEEFFPQNENLKTVLCQPGVKKSQNCEIFFWGYDGHTITRAEFTGMIELITGSSSSFFYNTSFIIVHYNINAQFKIIIDCQIKMDWIF
jgi:hypothetical protein